MKKRILLILTGGTIGSTIENNIINTNKNSIMELANAYKDVVNFEIRKPYYILSENVNCNYWNKLINCIKSANQDNYDGIIITHGSDTLAYTAALIGLCFNNTKIPIILTASNHPLSEEHSNGNMNFDAAVNYIKGNNPKGVFVIYANYKNEEIVYLATRLQEADIFIDQFSSFNRKDFGFMEGENLHLKKDITNPTIEELNSRDAINIGNIILNDNVLLITPYPCLNYDNINLNENIRAVFHWTYHSATLGKNVIEFIKRCKEKNIDFYMPAKGLENIYKTSSDILKEGVTTIGNISKECAYIKIIIAYNQNEMSPKEFLSKNIYYEKI